MGGGNNLLFRVVLLMLSLLCACFAQEVIILSDKCIKQNNTRHRADPCQTMDSAFADLHSNTTLQLKPGLYTIRSRSIVLNKTDLTIIGDTENPSSVIIQCDPSHGLVFISVKRLSFIGLTIRDCGFQGEDIERTFSYLRQFIDMFLDPFSDFSAGIFLADITDLTVEDVVIDNNIGLGLFGLNIVGNSRFSRVTFANNHPRMCAIEPRDIARSGGSGGAMYLQYQNYADTSSMTFDNSNLWMEDILVESNYNCRIDLFAAQHNMLTRSLEPGLISNQSFTGSGGITIALAQSSYSIRVNLTESLFRNNSGTFRGSALELGQYELTSDSHIYVTNTLFVDNGEFFVPNSQFDRTPGGPVVAAFYAPIPESYHNDRLLSILIDQAVSSVAVINCTFERNTARSGAGIYTVSFGPSVPAIRDEMIIRDCLFVNNSAGYGSAIFVTEISYGAFEPGVNVILDSITTTGNHKVDSNEGTSFQTDATGVIDINFVNVTLTGSNHFYSNRDTAFSAYIGIITLTGFANFTDNVGVYGGGLTLDTESYLVLTGESAEVLFMKNRALLNGGGIHVNFNTIRANTFDCFLFFDKIDPYCHVYNTCSPPKGRFNISFIDNMATFGHAIYGSSFSSCPWNILLGGRGVKYLSINDSTPVADSQLPIFLEPFTPNDGKTINTNAGSIVVDYSDFGSPRLSKNNTIQVYPGQNFFVPLGALDGRNQPVPLTVFSQLQAESAAHSLIGGTNRFLLTGGNHPFTNASFRVFGEENTLYNMTITSNEALLVNFVIEVSLSSCPVGFLFDLTDYECLCNVTELTGVSCNDDGTLSYPVDTWIGIDDQGRYLQGNCIPDFCVSGLDVLNFSEPDSQCQNNRTGILCGGCAENFSRMIGTSACGQCSHWYLFLIIPFLVLGILLFLVLAVFNVTITDGYINGFIFYANIVTVYLTNYVPVSSPAVYPPQVAIAFLNLNLGIPTCFFDGMTESILTVLRFLFPAYLMFILFLVVLCGKFISNEKVSTFFRKIKVTHVFATLILYSYTSIIQTCFDALAYVSVDGTENPVRWLRDPNVPYNDPWHIVLVVLSLLLLIVFIPFPLLLLFPSLTFRVPFIRNLKPLIDAFIAPFAPGRAFWVSFRLLFRLLFFIISSAFVDPIIPVVLAVLITSLTILEVRLKPFNSYTRNLVNRTLLSSLTIFSIIAVYLHPLNLRDAGTESRTVPVQLYWFFLLLMLLFLHYVLIRFSFTRERYQKVIDYITEKVNKLRGRVPTPSVEKPRKQSNRSDSEMNDLGTHTSVSLNASESIFDDAVFIPYREELLGDGDDRDSNKTLVSK